MSVTRNKIGGVLFSILFLASAWPLRAQELKPINLLEPQMDGGKPLMRVLKERKSIRSFSDKKIPLQTLSNLLWAAFGINRTDKGGRTAPSAMNMQEIDIYAAMAGGLYLYDAQDNKLLPILAEDIRALTGKQPFVKDAPLNLIFVADLSKMSKLSPETSSFYSATDTGFISQNVYLFCASSGLGTVVRGMMDSKELAKKMGLKDTQKIILSQTIGWPQ